MKEFVKISQEKLKGILKSIENKKNFIIEDSLIKPLELVCSASWLRSNGIDKIYRFDKKLHSPCESNTNVFFINANLKMFKITLDQIHAYRNKSSGKLIETFYHVIIYPDVFLSFYKLLEEEGLYGIVRLYRFNWNFLHLDDNLYSLELNQVYNEIFIQENYQLLKSIAQSFRLLNLVVGRPDYYVCCGQNSIKIVQMIAKFQESKAQFSVRNSKEMSTFILIDRPEDYSSCLLTPSIYSGLINEVFPIRAGEIKSPKLSEISKVLQTSPHNLNMSEKINFKINSNIDKIFEANRYRLFTEASQMVQANAKQLGVKVKLIHNLNLPEIEQYITKNLPKISMEKQKILAHMKICEIIIKMLAGNFRKRQTLEEDIIKGLDKRAQMEKMIELLLSDGHSLNSLRLLCLMNLSGNLSTEEYISFIQIFCSIFGFEYLTNFRTLSSGNLLPKIGVQKSKMRIFDKFSIPKFDDIETFQILANKLNSSENSKQKRLDYVFNGTYTPFVSKILITLFSTLQNGPRQEFLDRITCFESEEYKQLNFKQFKTESLQKLQKRGIFVFILGGITYSEIAACDHFSKITGIRVIASSNCIINGKEIVSVLNE